MRAVLFQSVGGPDVLHIEDQPITPPGPGELLIRVTSAGLNRADALHRQGRHLIRPRLPSRTGMEAAGVVEQVGDGVAAFQPGDRVAALPAAYDVSTQGGVAEYVTLPERLLVRTPASVDDRDAGAVWMQFLTVWGAMRFLYRVQPGDFVVITAGSSSVALAAVQTVNLFGGVSIVTTTSSAKMPRLMANGAAHVIDVTAENYVQRVREITRGHGVGMVFDSVAGAMVADHVRVCAPEAVILVYGALDHSPIQVNGGYLLAKNLTLRGYTLMPLLRDREALAQAVAEIAAGLDRGLLRLNVDRRFPMSEVRQAHRYMESNQQFGKIVINP